MKHVARFPTLAAFVVCAALGLAFGLDEPWTDDARFYVAAAESYATWLAGAAHGVVTLDARPLSIDALDRAFAVNHEHPPVAKYAMGIGWLVLHRLFGVDDVTACRVPIVLLWAWTCALVFRMVRQRATLLAGIFAAAAFATLPRAFFDGHAETLDLPVTAFIVASIERLLASLETPRWRDVVACVLLFGLALGSKLNAPFALAAACVYYALAALHRKEGTAFVTAPLPWALLGMALVSPLVAFALWPWLWLDTPERLAAYLHFHLAHYGILFYYLGHIYRDDVAPWTAPFAMAAFTLPLPILVMALAGAWRPIVAIVARLRSWVGAIPRRDWSPAEHLGVVALLQAVAQVGAVALPGVPVYGGVKLFLPAFPFLAILAGLAFATLEAEVRRPRLAAATGAALLLPGALGLLVYHGTWLSYYTEYIGGVRGAAGLGLEQQYYDLAYPELATALERALPHGGTFAVLPNPKEYAPYLTRWQRGGRLQGVRMTPPEQADVLVLTHERRWPQYPELMARYRTRRVLERFAVLGVPLFSLLDLHH